MDPLLWVLFFRQDLLDNQDILSVFLMKTDKHNCIFSSNFWFFSDYFLYTFTSPLYV